MSVSPKTASIVRLRSKQSPPRSTSQYHGQIPDADFEDPKLDPVPASCTDGEPTLVSSESQFRTNCFFGIARESHHSSTNSRPELNPSIRYRPIFSPEGGNNEVKSQVLCGSIHSGSAPVSPISRLTPTSAEAEQDDQADEEEEEEEEEEAVLTAESEESVGACQRPMTAAERRAEKRKARRFRLTHNQTRFLVNEFDRQAHPDAAQRERLSREVPGLSPRQVQVWFQNRRAKLKRLSSDDRERMTKARALPDTFGMTLRGLSQCTTTSTLSLMCYAPIYKGSENLRPSVIEDIMRHRDDNGNILPTSMDPGCNNIYTRPGAVATLANMSSATPMENPVGFGLQAVPQVKNRRQPDPLLRSCSPSTLYHSPFQIFAAPISDHGQPGQAESLASPLRSMISCSGSSFDYVNAPTPNAATSSYSRQNAQPGRILPGDERPQSSLVIARPCTVDPLPTSFHQATDDQACCSAADDSVESRPLGIDFPPSLSLHISSTHHLDRSNLERDREHQGLNCAPLAAPEDFHLRQFSSPYPAAFDPGFPLPGANPAIYAWEDPEPCVFSRDPDTQSLQHPLGNFDGIYRSGSFSVPDCNTGRPKSCAYGATYY